MFKVTVDPLNAPLLLYILVLPSGRPKSHESSIEDPLAPLVPEEPEEPLVPEDPEDPDVPFAPPIIQFDPLLSK